MSREKILIIEDDLQIRAMLETFLTAKGYAVASAEDGLAGIRVFAREQPSIVLLDMLLPKLLGSDVCDMLKRSVEGAKVPIVMMSAVLKADKLHKDLKGKKRPDAFLTKPFQFSEMLRVISALLQGRSAEDQESQPQPEVLEIVDTGGAMVYALSEVGVPVADADRGAAPAAPRSVPGPPPVPASPPPRGEPGAVETSSPVAPPPLSPPAVGTPSTLRPFTDRPTNPERIRLSHSPGDSTSESPSEPPGLPPSLGVPASPPVASPPASPPVASPPASPPVASPPASPPVASPPASPPVASPPVSPPVAPPPASPPVARTAAASSFSPSIPEAAPAVSAKKAPSGWTPSVSAPEPASSPPAEAKPAATRPQTEQEAEGKTPGASPRIIAKAVIPEEPPADTASVEFDAFMNDLHRTFAQDETLLSAASEWDEEEATVLALAPPPQAPAPESAKAIAEDRTELPPAEPEYVPGLGTIHPKHPTPGLRETTIPELLVLLYRQIFSGLLTLELQGGRKEIYFLNGYPVHVYSTYRGENLGRCLVRMGRISEEAYFSCLQYMAERKREPAEALVELGLVQAHELPPILRELQRENLLRCFSWNQASYELQRGADLVARVPVFEMNPVAIIAEGIYLLAEVEELSRALEPFADHYVLPTAYFSRYYLQLAPSLSGGDLEKTIDGTGTLSALVQGAGDAWPNMLRTVEILRVLEMITLAVEPAESPEPAAEPDLVWPEMAGEPAPAPSDPELEERILKTYLLMRRQNHFELLGVSSDADAEQIEAAYQELASQFHPDRLQAISSTEVRSKGKEIFLAIGEAYETLGDEERRREYLASIEPPPAQDESGSEPGPGPNAAEEELRKGEEYARQEDWARAQIAFMKALRLAPNEPECYLHLGWAMYRYSRETGKDSLMGKAIGFIRRVITMNPQEDRAYYYLGHFHLDKNQVKLARQLFKRALKYNPENAEARQALQALDAG